MGIMDRQRNPLPFEGALALRELGSNLRTARLRRNLTLDEVAKRIGIHRTTLAQAEKGDPTVMVGTYVSALWAYGLTPQLTELGAPDRDREGQAMEANSSRVRARPAPGAMSNDF